MKLSLPLRLSLWIGTLLVIFFAAALAFISLIWYRNTVDVLRAHGRTAARETAYNLDRVFGRIAIAANLAAAALEERPCPLDELQDTVSTVTAALSRQCPDLASYSIVYADGMLRAGERCNAAAGSVGGDGTVTVVRWRDGSSPDYFTKEWFLVPLVLEKPLWTVPYYSEIQPGTLILSYAVPFYVRRNGRRHPAGVVLADVKVAALEKYLHKFVIACESSSNRSTLTILMNQFGQVVISPDRGSELNQTLFSLCDDPEKTVPSDRRSAHRVLREADGHVQLENAAFGIGPSELFFAHCVNDWVVAIVIPDDWEARLLRPLLGRFLLGGAVVLILIVLVIFVVCRRLNRPLTELARAADAVGQGEFSAPLPAVRRDDEIGRLTVSFRHMQMELGAYMEKLAATVASRERAEGELRAAKAIQQDLLPHALPPWKNFENVHAAALLNPARGVGGDLYDVFETHSGKLALIVGDVSGKGVPAALFMAVTQTLQRGLGEHAETPDAVAARLNEMLSAHNESNMFVTYFMGFLDPRDGTFIYTNGGHNPPLLRRVDGTLEKLARRHGPPLAVMEECAYGATAIRLQPGDMLILYTDGVTEAFDGAGVMFGEAGLLDAVRALPVSASPETVVAAIHAAVAHHAAGCEASDDLTLLVVRYDDGSGNAGQ